jgi:hypothetical protein
VTDQICAWPDCKEPATALAVGRNEGHREVKKYCDKHAKAIALEQTPEYVADCPHCGCVFGIN